MRNGLSVTSESASDVRRICPPPSPNDPSMVINPIGQPQRHEDTKNRPAFFSSCLCAFVLAPPSIVLARFPTRTLAASSAALGSLQRRERPQRVLDSRQS